MYVETLIGDDGAVLTLNKKYCDVLQFLIKHHHIDLLCEFINAKWDNLFIIA